MGGKAAGGGGVHPEHLQDARGPVRVSVDVAMPHALL